MEIMLEAGALSSQGGPGCRPAGLSLPPALLPQGNHANRPTRVPPTPVPMAASVCPSSPRISAAALPASTAPPAGRTSTSAARARGCAATGAHATMRSAPTAASAVPPTRAPTASCPTCPAAPHPARTGAPAAPPGTPPTSVPAFQVGPAGLTGPCLVTPAWASSAAAARGVQEW